jgi:hypothetical protein
MPERAQLLNAGFSTADAAYPSFTMGDTGFSLEFLNWQERPIRVNFDNIAGVRWEALDGGDYQIYEMVDSVWVTSLLRTTEYAASDGLRHFRLCFNAHGVLDVLASHMRLVAG